MHTVLIVDDEPIVREGLAYIIDWQAAGFEIIASASDGLEGIEMIKKTPTRCRTNGRSNARDEWY